MAGAGDVDPYLEAYRRAEMLITAVVNPGIGDVRALVADDPDLPGTLETLAKFSAMLVRSLARHHGEAPVEFWSRYLVSERAAGR